MHPALATDLALARQTELLRAAEDRRRAGLARAARPARRPAPATIAASTAVSLQRLRGRAERLASWASPRQPSADPCCA